MRVLLLTQPGDGHFNPLVPVARALIAAGHEAVVVTSPAYVEDVERTGLVALGLGPEYRWDSALERWPEGAGVSNEDSPLFWQRRVHSDITVPFVMELSEHVRHEGADLLIAEWSVASWAQAIRDLAGVPFVVTGWAVEPGYEDIVELEESGANEARAALDLQPIAAVDPARWITFTPPSWGALEGPPLEKTIRARLPATPSGNPVPGHAAGSLFVYGTIGTVFYTMRSLLKVLVAAIEGGGWSGLVTVGRKNDPSRFRSSAHVAVEQYIPQADVLAVADVMVCHGGLGAVLGAMSQGCPMVVVPLGADQVHNAHRAQRLGVARIVDPAVVSVDVLREAIAETLTSEVQRQASAAVRNEIDAMHDVDELIETLGLVADGA